MRDEWMSNLQVVVVLVDVVVALITIESEVFQCQK